jgi:serine/threonine protein kinase
MNIFPCDTKEIIGQGSFGTVYRAVTRDNQEIALKVVKVANKTMEGLINREIAVMTQLNHPNIIRYLDSKVENGKYFIATEFCEGGDLENYLESRNQVSKETILFWFKGLVSALSYLQSQNKMHRDLKPANFYLSSKISEKAMIKIGDFGFARTLSGSLVESKLGTPLYMAPEILNGGNYDFRADVWSLGCVLFELVDGGPAFSARSIRELLEMQRQPIKFSCKFTHDEMDFIEWMLQFNPVDRPDFLTLENSQFVLRIQRVLDIQPQTLNRLVFENNFRNKMLLNIDVKLSDIIKIHQALNNMECIEIVRDYFGKYINKHIKTIGEKLRGLTIPAPSDIVFKFDCAEKLQNDFLERYNFNLKGFNADRSSIDQFIVKLIEISYEFDLDVQLLFIQVGLYYDPNHELLYEFFTNNKPPEIDFN